MQCSCKITAPGNRNSIARINARCFASVGTNSGELQEQLVERWQHRQQPRPKNKYGFIRVTLCQSLFTVDWKAAHQGQFFSTVSSETKNGIWEQRLHCQSDGTPCLEYQPESDAGNYQNIYPAGCCQRIGLLGPLKVCRFCSVGRRRRTAEHQRSTSDIYPCQERMCSAGPK